METCPDCTYVEKQVKDNGNYEIIDIGKHVRNLKAFLKLRDSNPVFDNAKKNGAAGIPCFVLEDGTVTLVPEEAGLRSRPSGAEKAESASHLIGTEEENGASCSIDGHGC